MTGKESIKWQLARNAWVKHKAGEMTLDDFWSVVRGLNND